MENNMKKDISIQLYICKYIYTIYFCIPEINTL